MQPLELLGVTESAPVSMLVVLVFVELVLGVRLLPAVLGLAVLRSVLLGLAVLRSAVLGAVVAWRCTK